MGIIKWYKRDPDAALAGMAMLTLEQRGAYNTVLDLIYSTADNLADNDQHIAGALGCDVRVWKRIRADLLRLGKLHTSGELLRNFRATSEISYALEKSEKCADAGRASGRSRSKNTANPNDNNGLAGTDVQTPVRTDVKKTFEHLNSHNHNQKAAAALDSVNGHATQGTAVQTVDSVARALQAMPELAKHPVAVAPDVSPIWRMVQAGWDFEGVIVPGIRRLAQRSQIPIRGWKYFAKILLEEGQPQAVPPPPTEELTDERWRLRMDYARQKRWWDFKKNGPLPHTPGCRVPGHLLQPDDGKGWIDYEDRPR